MYRQRSSRLSKTPEGILQIRLSPNQEVIQSSWRSKKETTGLGKSDRDSGVVFTREGRNYGLNDIINRSSDDRLVAEEQEVEFVEVTDEGLDHLDEDRCSANSSLASGPSLMSGTLPDWCSACRKLYQKARRMKAPVQTKLLDNDPKSLTCDQWVLMKTRRPRRLPDAGGKILTHLQLVKKRLKVQSQQCVGGGKQSSCLRPHTFLQRNLRPCSRVSVKTERKKNRRKRRRDDSQGSYATKQQRLQLISEDCPDSSRLHSTGGYEGWRKQEMGDRAEDVVAREAATSQNAPKKPCRFRDLLAQMRANGSMIVRERR